MGAGIALCTLNAGLPTILIDKNSKTLEQAVARIRGSYDGVITKGRMDAPERDRRLLLLTTSTDYAALGNADVIIEAVFEDLKVKQDIFRAFDPDREAWRNSVVEYLRPQCRPDRGCNAACRSHGWPAFLQPRERDATAGGRSWTADVACHARDSDVPCKTPWQDTGRRACVRWLYRQPDVRGVSSSGELLLDEGATPAQVDGALERWGMAMGPFAVMDLAGGDIAGRSAAPRP